MSRFNLSRLFAVLTLVVAAVAPAAAQDDKVSYRMGLLIGTPDDRKTDTDVLNVASKAFSDSRRFTLVERSQLDKVFTEKDLKSFLGKGSKTLSDVLGLDFLGIVGYFVEERRLPNGNRIVFTIEVRLVNAETGEVMGTIESERSDFFTPPSTPREAGRGLFQNIREAFPPFGYIVKTMGKEVIVDLGSEAGIKEGDVLEIVREGEQILHPVTGEALPAEMIVIGELKVVSTSAQLSNCKFKAREGEAPLGNPVRLKEQNGSWKKWVGKGREILLGQ